MLEYHASYYQIEDGWYMAKVLDFPGVASQGFMMNSGQRSARGSFSMLPGR